MEVAATALRLLRIAQMVGDTPSHMAVTSVALRPQRTREPILDFTVKVGGEGPTPAEARVARALEGAIRSALEAGWDPESRGRAFRFEIAAS